MAEITISIVNPNKNPELLTDADTSAFNDFFDGCDSQLLAEFSIPDDSGIIPCIGDDIDINLYFEEQMLSTEGLERPDFCEYFFRNLYSKLRVHFGVVVYRRLYGESDHIIIGICLYNCDTYQAKKILREKGYL